MALQIMGVILVLLGVYLSLSFSLFFLLVSLSGLLLALGVQTTISILRAGFEHMVSFSIFEPTNK